MKLKFSYCQRYNQWLKRNMPKIISTSLLFNNLFIYSNASNLSAIDDLSDNNRYETYSGILINVKDSNGNSLEEIKIFGNTYQNESDLSEIESIGKLYVDKNGDPILDKYGREQYKISIISTSENLFNKDLLMTGACNYGTPGKPIYRPANTNRLTLTPENAIPVNKNSTIVVNSTNFKYGLAQLSNGVSLGDMGWVTGKTVLTLDEKTTHIAFNIANLDNSDLTKEDISLDDIMVYCQDDNMDNKSHLSSEVEILLPQQLQRLGDVQDKLYFDKSRGKYIIEKNIENLILNGTENWYRVDSTATVVNTLYFGFNEGFDFIHTSKVLSDKFIQPDNTILSEDKEGISIRNNSHSIPTMYIKINENKLSDYTVNSFKEWLSNNNVLVKYQLKEPQFIELENLNKIKLPMYNNETNIYVSSKNSISADIEIVVDRLVNIAKDNIEKAELNPTVYNISMARHLINMLDESILKDSLQDALNTIFATESMVLEKKKTTANIDLYIKPENSLSMSLSTNFIIFEDVSGVEDTEKLNAVDIVINSSLPYQLNSYLESEIKNEDGSNIIPKELLNIRLNGENDYKAFSNVNEKLVLKDNCEKGKDNTHSIDLILKGNRMYDADIYKTVIKFEAEQK